MGESNTVVSAYTLYRHLQQYWSHPSILAVRVNKGSSVASDQDQTLECAL